MVLAIAGGQLAIAILLVRSWPWRALGVFGALVFLMAIAPLGVGSAFPFSATFSAAILMMDGRLLESPDIRQQVLDHIGR
jgi:hypothetical protein